MDRGYSSEAQRWQALLERDPRAEGAFFYGVTTTGIYCRPVCSSRRPNRENVVYFDSNAAAVAAGFRPCRRCTPDGDSPDEARRELILRACKMIEEAEATPSLGELARAVDMSPSHFHRLFKQAVGVTPKEYAAALRLDRLKSELRPGASVTGAAYEAGFGSSSRLYETSNGMLGMTPSRYKEGGAGVQIQFAVVDSSLGRLLVAATDRGLCAIEFGDTAGELVDRLQERFPRADLVKEDGVLAGWVAQVAAFIETPARGLDLPLDIQGTAFQRRVWKALRGIPAGSTRSYADVAREIGQPSAARAVAGACAANKLAVAIPCHRVVRGDGEPGGYRWGVERKRALLAREAAA